MAIFIQIHVSLLLKKNLSLKIFAAETNTDDQFFLREDDL